MEPAAGWRNLGRAARPNVFSNRNPASTASHSTIILLDGVNGWFENFVQSRQAVVGVLDKAPADERFAVFAITGDRGLVVLQDFTTDRALLLRNVGSYTAPGLSPGPPQMENPALAMKDVPEDTQATRGALKQSPKVREYQMRRASEVVRLAGGSRRAAGAIAGPEERLLAHARIPAAADAGHGEGRVGEDVHRTQPGERGGERGGRERPGGPPRLWGPGAILTMQQIAEQTGGAAFFHRNDLDAAMAQSMGWARSSYTVGFYLAETERDGKYHRVTGRPRAARPGLQNCSIGPAAVDTLSEAEAKPAARKKTVSDAILSGADSAEIGITGVLGVTGGQVQVSLSVDPDGLTLRESKEGGQGKIVETLVEWNAAGRQVAQIPDDEEVTRNCGRGMSAMDCRWWTSSRWRRG